MKVCIFLFISGLIVTTSGNKMDRFQDEVLGRNKRALLCFHYPECCSIVKNGRDQCAWACPVCPRTEAPATKDNPGPKPQKDDSSSSSGGSESSGGSQSSGGADPFAAFGIGGVNIFEGEVLDVEGFGEPIDYDEYYDYDDDDDVEGRNSEDDDDINEDYGDYEPDARIDNHVNSENIDMMMKKFGIYNMINNYNPRKYKDNEKSSSHHHTEDHIDSYQAPPPSPQYHHRTSPPAPRRIPHHYRPSHLNPRYSQPTHQRSHLPSHQRTRPTPIYSHDKQKHIYSLPKVSHQERRYLFGSVSKSQATAARKETQPTTFQKIVKTFDGTLNHFTSLLSSVSANL